MINYVKERGMGEYIVATEAGILDDMKDAVPEADFFAAPIRDDNSCACSECANMKLNTLEKLYFFMLEEQPAIKLDKRVMRKALVPIHLMLEISKM